MFDLSHITAAQVVVVALALTAVDFVGAVLPALIASLTHTGTGLDPAVIAQFLDTHVLKRVFPIFGLLLISATLPAPASDAVFVIAIAGLAAYLAETVASVASNLPAGAQPATPPAPPVAGA